MGSNPIGSTMEVSSLDRLKHMRFQEVDECAVPRTSLISLVSSLGLDTSYIEA